MSRRGLAVAALSALALVAVTTFVINRHQQREDEWAHGGDSVHATVDLRILTGPEEAKAAAEALGGAGINILHLEDGQQAIIMRVDWIGPSLGGHYNFLLLDRRTVPARPLRPQSSWSHDHPEGDGSGWHGAWFVLAERYSWLEGIREDTDPMATGSYAAGRGFAAAQFVLPPNSIPIERTTDLLPVLFHSIDGGEVRWARTLPQPEV